MNPSGSQGLVILTAAAVFLGIAGCDEGPASLRDEAAMTESARPVRGIEAESGTQAATPTPGLVEATPALAMPAATGSPDPASFPFSFTMRQRRSDEIDDEIRDVRVAILGLKRYRYGQALVDAEGGREDVEWVVRDPEFERSQTVHGIFTSEGVEPSVPRYFADWVDEPWALDDLARGLSVNGCYDGLWGGCLPFYVDPALPKRLEAKGLIVLAPGEALLGRPTISISTTVAARHAEDTELRALIDPETGFVVRATAHWLNTNADTELQAIELSDQPYAESSFPTPIAHPRPLSYVTTRTFALDELHDDLPEWSAMLNVAPPGRLGARHEIRPGVFVTGTRENAPSELPSSEWYAYQEISGDGGEDLYFIQTHFGSILPSGYALTMSGLFWLTKDDSSVGECCDEPRNDYACVPICALEEIRVQPMEDDSKPIYYRFGDSGEEYMGVWQVLAWTEDWDQGQILVNTGERMDEEAFLALANELLTRLEPVVAGEATESSPPAP